MKFGRDEEEALGLQGTANAGDGGGKLFFEEGVRLSDVGDVFVEGTFQDVGEHQAEFLEFGEDGFGDFPSVESWTALRMVAASPWNDRVGRVEEVGVARGGDAGEQKSLDVKWTKTRGPGEAFEATRDVGGIGELAATVAREKDGIGHGCRKS